MEEVALQRLQGLHGEVPQGIVKAGGFTQVKRVDGKDNSVPVGKSNPYPYVTVTYHFIHKR